DTGPSQWLALSGGQWDSRPSAVKWEHESGQLLLDRKRCSSPLHRAAKMAIHLGQLSPYLPGDGGDKDLFQLAWTLEHRQFATCPKGPAAAGARDARLRSRGCDFVGHTMVQHSPGGIPFFLHRTIDKHEAMWEPHWELVAANCDEAMCGLRVERIYPDAKVGGRPNPIRAAWPVADPSLGLGARQLVVPAREFKAILEGVGETSKAYAGNPLAQLCPKRRGQVLQNAVRQVLSQKHSDMQVEDPFPGIGIRGTRLRPDQARYDFSIGGRRVECKSAQLCWYQAEVRWKAQFCGIKLDQNQFDDLYLALFTPSNVLVLQHDLHTCMSRAGRHTAELGWRVTVGGRKHQTNWRDANVALAKQLFNADSNCRPVAVLQVNGPEISVALSHASGSRSKQLADKFYKESPLQLANPSTRGLRIEAIAFELDKRMHPEALNGTRVEVKHGVLRFKDQRCVWTCSFTGIRSRRAGTDKDAKDRNCWTPLHLAARERHADCVELLLEQQVKARIVTSSRDVKIVPFDEYIPAASEFRRAFDEIAKEVQAMLGDIDEKSRFRLQLNEYGIVRACAILVKQSRLKGGDWVPQTGVILQEALKGLASLVLAARLGEPLAGALLDPRELIRSSVPAFLYLVQNNLQYVSLAYLEPATYTVTYQLKILSTAVCFVLLLGQRLTLQRWLALGLLVVGVVLVQLATLEDELPDASRKSRRVGWSGQVTGLLTTMLSAAISGLAGVYTEKILKGSNVTLWVRNVQLAAWSAVIGLAGLAGTGDLEGIQRHGFFYGYNAWICASVCNNAFGGLLIAAVIKYADNILKNFATSVSIVLTTALSIMYFGLQLNGTFLVGVVAVCYSIFLYGGARVLPFWDVRGAKSKAN
ncbi:Slc35a3, partial [Symbiodinium microadriaticum]